MRVTLLNKEYLKENFFRDWGLAAACCYDSPDRAAVAIGKGVLKSGHFSGSRGTYFRFRIDDVPRSLVDQLVRHEQGVFKNVQSFRYVNKEAFTYYKAPLVQNCEEANKIYDETMAYINDAYSKMNSILTKHYEESETITTEHINQSVRGVLPMNTNTSLVIGFTIEALIHLANMRLCTRAEEHIRKLARLIINEAIDTIPELKEHLVAICDKLGYCPEGEKHTCKRKPLKENVNDLIMKGTFMNELIAQGLVKYELLDDEEEGVITNE